uniref:Peroxisomal ATPase PEX1 n=1 Tax=Culicoides sonorensis TaxID=179676 RepID=A0A336LXY7_CULSO
MFKRALNVKYSPIKNNFVLLPDVYLRLVNSSPNSALVLNAKSKSTVVSWLPYGGAVEPHEIGMNALMSEVLGLKEGETVTCSVVTDVRSITTLHVSPVAKKDLEILMMSPTRIQNELLEQIRIVNRGQVFMSWISRSISVRLQVDNMSPSLSYGRLENNSELHISTSVAGVPIVTEPSSPTLTNGHSNKKPAEESSSSPSYRKRVTERKPSTKESIFDRVERHLDPGKEERELDARIANVIKRDNKPALPKRNSFIATDYDSTPPDSPCYIATGQAIANDYNDRIDGIINGLRRSVTMADMKFKEFENDYRNGSSSASRESSIVSPADSWTDVKRTMKKERAHETEFRIITGKWEDEAPISDVYVTKENLPSDFDTTQVYNLRTTGDKEYFVNVKVINDKEFPRNRYPTLEMNENLMKILELKPFERVILKSKPILLNCLDKLELIPSKKLDESTRDPRRRLETTFKNHIIDNTKLYPLLLNQDQVVRCKDQILTVKLWPMSLKCATIDSKLLKESKIDVMSDFKSVSHITNPEPEKKEKDEEGNVKTKGHHVTIPKFKEIEDECVERLRDSLCLTDSQNVPVSNNLLIVGLSNSGKTTLVNGILKKLQEKPYYTYVHRFSCIKNKGRKPESIQKDLRVALNQCLLHHPSILVMDTLDYITQAEDEQQSHDTDYYNKVSDLIRNVISEYTSHGVISVIATANNLEQLNKRIFPRKGFHLFHKIISMPGLEKPDRETFIKESCLNSKIRDRKLINWDKYANMTDGYKIGDLAFFIERSIYYAFKKNPKEPTLMDENLKDALKVTNEIFLQGIESHSQSELEEADIPGDQIPGLEKAIEVFEEVIKWPIELPGIFDKAPIKLPKGILLYGPPGVGKTFFVKQIAKTWSLRMISVKGPELLAKFIGQSEENVRNLFQKARAARPCVLFFDEFDSLAPRRGHDSTGVTDRVVNQFLTQLDGVEELQGVIVVAATSRPELLDPAIIRPGRIDRHIEISLPNKASRVKILKALSSTLHIEKNVDFKEYAEKMDRFTGADIMSFLTTANMDAVQEFLDSHNSDEASQEFVTITKKHLKTALSKTKPSIKPADLERYKHTYAQFINKSEPTPLNFVGQKATLA